MTSYSCRSADARKARARSGHWRVDRTVRRPVGAERAVSARERGPNGFESTIADGAVYGRLANINASMLFVVRRSASEGGSGHNPVHPAPTWMRPFSESREPHGTLRICAGTPLRIAKRTCNGIATEDTGLVWLKLSARGACSLRNLDAATFLYWFVCFVQDRFPKTGPSPASAKCWTNDFASVGGGRS